MPRFMISTIIFGTVAWGTWLYFLFFIAPQEDLTVLLFTLNLVVVLLVTLGTGVYFLTRRFTPSWTNDREVFRRSLKLTLPPTLAVGLVLMLRYFGLDSAVSLGIIGLLGVLTEIYFLQQPV